MSAACGRSGMSGMQMALILDFQPLRFQRR